MKSSYLQNKKFKIYRRRFTKVFIKLFSITLFLLFFSGMYYLFLESTIFKVSNIEVLGTKSFVNETDLKELASSRSLGKNIFKVDKNNLSQSLSRDFQGGKKFKVKRKLPSTILIEVEERVPLAAVKDNSGKYFLVDEDGYVLGEVNPKTTNLPEVNYYKEISVGYVLEPNLVVTFLELIKALDKQKILPTNVQVNKDYISFVVEDVEILVGNEKDKDKIASGLKSLLTKLSTEGKNPSRIDLRYDKVVVSYKK